MKCSHAKLLISWAMDEPLPEYDRAQLEAHVQACAGCAQYGTQLDHGRALLARAMANPPDNFEWKVQLKIQQALREAASQGLPAMGRSRFWLPVGITAATTALLVVAVGGLVLLDPDALPGLRRDRQIPAVAENAPLVSVDRSAAPLDVAVQPVPDARQVADMSTPPSRTSSGRATLPPRRSYPSESLLSPDNFGGIQQVGQQLVADPSIISDDPRFAGVPGQFDPRILARRDQLERQLLDAQALTDRLRRQLDEFEYGGVGSAAQATLPDTLPVEADPDR
jgi:hypothetical protein